MTRPPDIGCRNRHSSRKPGNAPQRPARTDAIRADFYIIIPGIIFTTQTPIRPLLHLTHSTRPTQASAYEIFPGNPTLCHRFSCKPFTLP